MTFLIYNDVAKPAGTRLGSSKYPVDQLTVGQMLFMPIGDEPAKRVKNRAQSVRQAANKRYPERKHSMHAIDVNGANGFGIWRDA